MITTVIVGHASRAWEIATLQRDIGGAVFLDDGTLGEWSNHARALEYASQQDAQWALIVQDDALPIAGFRHHVSEALRRCPNTLVSFYVGTSRPPQWMDSVYAATIHADRLEAAWLECSTLLWGVAVAMPVEHIEPFLRWADRSRLPYDQRLGAWYDNIRRPVRYTWPSLVDHADGPTLVRHADGYPRTEPRHARRVGTPTTWETVAVPIH